MAGWLIGNCWVRERTPVRSDPSSDSGHAGGGWRNITPGKPRRLATMNYQQALEYLQEIDTVPYCDTKFTDAINKAKAALQDCLEIGLTGDDEESIRAGP